MTFLATVLLFCAAQMVRVVPLSLAVSFGQLELPPLPLSPEPELGLLQAARTSDATTAAVAPSLLRIMISVRFASFAVLAAARPWNGRSEAVGCAGRSGAGRSFVRFGPQRHHPRRE